MSNKKFTCIVIPVLIAMALIITLVVKGAMWFTKGAIQNLDAPDEVLDESSKGMEKLPWEDWNERKHGEELVKQFEEE